MYTIRQQQPPRYTAPPPGSQFGFDSSMNQGSAQDFLNRFIQAVYPGALNSAFFTSSWGQPQSERATLDMFNSLTPGGARARSDTASRGFMSDALGFGNQAAASLAGRGYGTGVQESAKLDAINKGRMASSDYRTQANDPLNLAKGRYEVAQQAGMSPATQLFQTLLGQSQPQGKSGPSIFESVLGLAGGLASGGAFNGLFGKIFSDRRLKSNIVRVGTHPLGIGVYEYDIFGKRQRGVMADEVERVVPEAVTMHESGYKLVDYSKIGGL